MLGICGGFQLLGRTIRDPDGIEGPAGTTVQGLGLLDTTTVFAREKVLRLSRGVALGAPVSGYEIHHGVVSGSDEVVARSRDGQVFGTMVHGSLESDQFRRAFLTEVVTAVGRTSAPSDVSFEAARLARLDVLADLVDKHVDVEAITALISNGPPAALPVLPPGEQR